MGCGVVIFACRKGLRMVRSKDTGSTKRHHGTGDIELTIRNLDDLEKAKPLIQRSFEEN